MAPDVVLACHRPLDEIAAAVPAAALRPLPPAARFILRSSAPAIAAAGPAFGVAMPERACRAAVTGERASLWLGPDEWLLLAPVADGPALVALLEQAMGSHPHSLADVSQRQTAIEVYGSYAETILNAGVPLDVGMAAFPVGMCTRTVLAKAEVILWRTAAETFRLEVFRSFADYVWRFLAEAGREFSR